MNNKLTLIIYILANIALIQINYNLIPMKNSDDYCLVTAISVLFFVGGFLLTLLSINKTRKLDKDLLYSRNYNYQIICLITLYPVLNNWINWVLFCIAVIIIVIFSFFYYIDQEDDEVDRLQMLSQIRATLFYVILNVLMYNFEIFQTPSLFIFLLIGSYLPIVFIQIKTQIQIKNRAF